MVVIFSEFGTVRDLYVFVVDEVGASGEGVYISVVGFRLLRVRFLLFVPVFCL